MAKLLLVEDDNNLREIYEARLQAEGYTIVSAKDGEEALVVAKAEKPDLVISDVMMPKISGFEMLDIMRNTEELKNVKVIMLTALGQSDDQQRADKLGADRYLVKSQVTLEDIVKVAHDLLEGDSAPAASSAPDTAATDKPAPAAEPAAEPAAPAAEPAPETKAEDVKPEPAPAAPTAEPEPAAESKDEAKDDSKPEPDATASNEAAKSTTQEEADVEAKIEDFVAGASSEPTAPASGTSEAAAPAAPAPDDSKDSASDDSKSAVASSDDKLMADAVDDLVSSTDKAAGASDTASSADSAADTAAKPATVIPVSVADEPADKPEDKAEEKVDNKTEKETDHKVIQPLEGGATKKDINQLLAEEEAKEAQTVPGSVVTAETPEEDKPSGQPATPQAETKAPGSDVDPNSIAL